MRFGSVRGHRQADSAAECKLPTAGIGDSVARRFAREGFAVGLFSRSREKLEPVEQAIVKDGGRALSVSVDAGADSSCVVPHHSIMSPQMHAFEQNSLISRATSESTRALRAWTSYTAKANVWCAAQGSVRTSSEGSRKSATSWVIPRCSCIMPARRSRGRRRKYWMSRRRF